MLTNEFSNRKLTENSENKDIRKENNYSPFQLSSTHNELSSQNAQISVWHQSKVELIIHQIPWYANSQTDQLKMFRDAPQQIASIASKESKSSESKVDRFLKENEEFKVPDESSSEHNSTHNQSQVKFEDWYPNDSDTSSDSDESKSDQNRIPTFKYQYQDKFAPDNKTKDINSSQNHKINNNEESESKEALSSFDSWEARKIVYSQNKTQIESSQMNQSNKKANILSGSQSANSCSESSSQFSEEFLNNDGYLTSSNESSFETSSIKSSNESDIKNSMTYNPYKNMMSDTLQKTQTKLYGSGIYQNNLSYSWSEIDKQEENQQPNQLSELNKEFISNNNINFRTPQMQVFEYQPVSKNNSSFQKATIPNDHER